MGFFANTPRSKLIFTLECEAIRYACVVDLRDSMCWSCLDLALVLFGRGPGTDLYTPRCNLQSYVELRFVMTPLKIALLAGREHAALVFAALSTPVPSGRRSDNTEEFRKPWVVVFAPQARRQSTKTPGAILQRYLLIDTTRERRV